MKIARIKNYIEKLKKPIWCLIIIIILIAGVIKYINVFTPVIKTTSNEYVKANILIDIGLDENTNISNEDNEVINTILEKYDLFILNYKENDNGILDLISKEDLIRIESILINYK